jgi:integrase/recombinase XerC
MTTTTEFSTDGQQFSATGKLTTSAVLGSKEHPSHTGAEPVLPTPDVQLSTTWQQFLKLYEYHLQTLGRTPTTIASQRSTGRLLGIHACADGITGPSGVTKTWLTDYLMRQYEVRKPGGRVTFYESLKIFWTWWAEEEGMPSPMAKIPRPKPAPLPDVPVITKEQFRALIAACGKDFEGRRNRTILLFLWQSGLRRMEVSRLDVADVDPDTGTVKVRCGKNGKFRVTRVGTEAVAAMLRYMIERDARAAESAGDALFISVKGERLTPGGIAQVVKALGRVAGIPDLHTHRFRHSWAGNLHGAGMSETSICQLAGWTDTAMLFRYGRATAAERALAEAESYLPGL